MTSEPPGGNRRLQEAPGRSRRPRRLQEAPRGVTLWPIWSIFGTTLGSHWGHSGVTPRSLWGHTGAALSNNGMTKNSLNLFSAGASAANGEGEGLTFLVLYPLLDKYIGIESPKGSRRPGPRGPGALGGLGASPCPSQQSSIATSQLNGAPETLGAVSLSLSLSLCLCLSLSLCLCVFVPVCLCVCVSVSVSVQDWAGLSWAELGWAGLG